MLIKKKMDKIVDRTENFRKDSIENFLLTFSQRKNSNWITICGKNYAIG